MYKPLFTLAMTCINKIEDYFEYSNESSKDKQKVMGFIENLTDSLAKYTPIPKPYSKALGKILEEQGVLQIDTSSRLSLGAKALLDEADALVLSGFLTSVTGIHGIRTFQPKQEENP
jgi:hypothetical protein